MELFVADDIEGLGEKKGGKYYRLLYVVFLHIVELYLYSEDVW